MGHIFQGLRVIYLNVNSVNIGSTLQNIVAVGLNGDRYQCHLTRISRYRVSQKNTKQAQRRAAADRSRHKSHGRIQYQGTYFLT